MDILLAHATDTPPSFAQLGLKGWVPREVERLVMDCLEKNPEDRPQSARDLAERFDTALVRIDVGPVADDEHFQPRDLHGGALAPAGGLVSAGGDRLRAPGR